jgi:methionyl aminopeptidase
MRKAGDILHRCLEHVATLVKPGITTAELNEHAEEFISSHEDAVPAFKGYHGYPSALCTSVNEECVHGLPGARILEEGDIISIDCGVIMNELYTDACITVPVGSISPKAKKLMDITKKALTSAIKILKEGVHVGDISSMVEKTVRKEGFAPIRILTGHGLGHSLHQAPDIPNWGKKGTGPTIPANTVIAIEPIISAGSDDITESKDGWTLVTADGALAAHFEHTILITEKGSEILA